MTDYFALLDEPRRPWLDADLLKAKFIARSAHDHPDRVHGATASEKLTAARRYAELNAAYSCLRDPKERLAHLLQLELAAKPKDLQEMPDALAETFLTVAQLCRQVDDFLKAKSQVSSPMLQLQFFERTQEWMDKLNALQQRLAAQRDSLTDALQMLDREWDEARTEVATHRKLLVRAEELYRQLGFQTRWTAQIQERLARLVE